MENLIKARLNQSQGNSTIASSTTTSNVQTSKPAAAPPSPHQGGLDVHPEPGNCLKGIDNKTIKGFLISKCLFGVIVWTKKPTIFFKDFCPSL